MTNIPHTSEAYMLAAGLLSFLEDTRKHEYS